MDSIGEDEGGMFQENSIETSILSRMKQTISPGWMHETSAQGSCIGKTQRDGMEREAGGGIGMVKTCKLKKNNNTKKKEIQFLNLKKKLKKK